MIACACRISCYHATELLFKYACQLFTGYLTLRYMQTCTIAHDSLPCTVCSIRDMHFRVVTMCCTEGVHS